MTFFMISLTTKAGSTVLPLHLPENVFNKFLSKFMGTRLRHSLDSATLALSGITPNLQPVIHKLLQLKY